MTLAARTPRKPLEGRSRPRLAPPRPLHHALEGYRSEAQALGIEPMPWQETAATYMTATGPDDLWLYREIAALVGRQNGKTTLVKPEIVRRLKAGRHIMHIAQVRELPRIMFEAIADALESDPSLFPRRRGKIIWPRRGAGSESIVLTNGGSYRIAAAISGSARGHSIDDLIIDELREMDSFDVINSAKPAQRFSDNPQTIYLSNAGTDTSVVLNSLRKRSQDDPSLAYLEWSADPTYAADDRRGWVQANPAIGHFPQVLRDLEKDYVAAKLGGNMAGFEVEALCRWVPTTRELLVDLATWSNLRVAAIEPRDPTMAVSIDPERQRASVALAWFGPDGIRVSIVRDVRADAVDTDALGKDIRALAAKHGVRRVGYDPLTDAEPIKYLKKAEPISGQKYANASAQFAGLVAAGGVHWQDADALTDDLGWTARKLDRSTGSFEAVRAQDERPITASLAAIRAVWLASGLSLGKPKVM